MLTFLQKVYIINFVFLYRAKANVKLFMFFQQSPYIIFFTLMIVLPFIFVNKNKQKLNLSLAWKKIPVTKNNKSNTFLSIQQDN